MSNLCQGNQLAVGLAGRILKLANMNMFTAGLLVVCALLPEIILIVER